MQVYYSLNNQQLNHSLLLKYWLNIKSTFIFWNWSSMSDARCVFSVFFLQHLWKICFFKKKSSIHQPLISATLLKEIDDTQPPNYSCMVGSSSRSSTNHTGSPRNLCTMVPFIFYDWKNTNSQILALPSRGQSCKLRGRGTKAVLRLLTEASESGQKEEHTFLTQLF